MNYFRFVSPSDNILLPLHYYHTNSLAIVNHYQSYIIDDINKCIDRWKPVMSSIFSIAKKYMGWQYHWNFENQHWVQNQGVNTLWPVFTFSIATCRDIDMCFRRIKFRHKPLAWQTIVIPHTKKLMLAIECIWSYGKFWINTIWCTWVQMLHYILKCIHLEWRWLFGPFRYMLIQTVWPIV